MTNLNDFRGALIAVGQVVVYPRRSGSSLWMESGVVHKVDSDNRKLVVTKANGRRVTLTNISNVVVVA